MWTPTTREQYTRTAARYETDLTDAEWAMIEPHMPPRSKRGRPPSWTFREILDAIFYVLRGGIPWRLMPSDLPPCQTVYGRFAAWRDSGLFETINHALVMTHRVRVGREASFQFRLADPGVETVTALCNASRPVTRGFEPDPAARGFTQIGPYADRLARQIAAESTQRSRTRQIRVEAADGAVAGATPSRPP